jgi:tRNA-dihydrouridine synthase B
MSIGAVPVHSPFGIAPMAGLSDSPFRRLVKRLGGCGIVFTEMVSADGLARRIHRTLDYLEFSEEERPIAIQIFGSDPQTMAAAAQIVESRGADFVDVNMGCPVPKIVRRDAGCSLMRTPERATAIVAAITRAVRIPVTVKMRAGWSEQERNAPELARRLEDAGVAAVAVHGRTAEQNYRGSADWDLVLRIADELSIPVFGSGDCTEPRHLVTRLRSGVDGVLVGRGVLRNPWILAQAVDLAAGRSLRDPSLEERGRLLLDYLDLLPEHLRTTPNAAVRHRAHFPDHSDPAASRGGPRPDRRPETGDRWVVNKVRALASWYTRGLQNGSHMRMAVNSARSSGQIRELVDRFFFQPAAQA